MQPMDHLGFEKWVGELYYDARTMPRLMTRWGDGEWHSQVDWTRLCLENTGKELPV